MFIIKTYVRILLTLSILFFLAFILFNFFVSVFVGRGFSIKFKGNYTLFLTANGNVYLVKKSDKKIYGDSLVLGYVCGKYTVCGWENIKILCPLVVYKLQENVSSIYVRNLFGLPIKKEDILISSNESYRFVYENNRTKKKICHFYQVGEKIYFFENFSLPSNFTKCKISGIIVPLSFYKNAYFVFPVELFCK